LNENDRLKILKEILRSSEARGRLIVRLLSEAPPVIATADSRIAQADSLKLMREEEDLLLADHPGKSCSDSHPGEDHGAYVKRMEDEKGEEERLPAVPRFTVRRSRDTNEAVLSENTRLQQNRTLEKLQRLRETKR